MANYNIDNTPIDILEDQLEWDTYGDLRVVGERDIVFGGIGENQSIEEATWFMALDTDGNLKDGYREEEIEVEVLAGVGNNQRVVGTKTLKYYYKITGDDSQEIPGCTDPDDPNYNPNATIDDGSCENNQDPGTERLQSILGYFIQDQRNPCLELNSGNSTPIRIWWYKDYPEPFGQLVFAAQTYDDQVPQPLNLGGYSHVVFPDSGYGNKTLYRINSRLSKTEDFKNGFVGNEEPELIYFIEKENAVECKEQQRLQKVTVQLSTAFPNTETTRQFICNSIQTVDVYIKKDLTLPNSSFASTVLFADEFGVNVAPSSLFNISTPFGLSTANIIKLANGQGLVDEDKYFILERLTQFVTDDDRVVVAFRVNQTSSGTCGVDGNDGGGGDSEELTDCEIKDRNISPEDLRNGPRYTIICNGEKYIWSPDALEWIRESDLRGDNEDDEVGGGGGNGSCSRTTDDCRRIDNQLPPDNSSRVARATCCGVDYVWSPIEGKWNTIVA